MEPGDFLYSNIPPETVAGMEESDVRPGAEMKQFANPAFGMTGKK